MKDYRDMDRMPEFIAWLEEQCELAREAQEPEICPVCEQQRSPQLDQFHWDNHLAACVDAANNQDNNL